MNIKNKIKRLLRINDIDFKMRNYKILYEKHAFVDCQCKDQVQFRSSIIRLYHTIEKGLSYEQFRPGFGKDNIEKLIVSLNQYCSFGYDTHTFYYETAVSCLHQYIAKNKQFGYVNQVLENKIMSIPGNDNNMGGTVLISRPINNEDKNFQELLKTRHSIRHFSNKPVDIDQIKKAIVLAQHTPSACNRQGWKTRIITDKIKIHSILSNQNGNRGFGQEIDKLLVITADLRSQQKNRELFQVFIDGGMYAESILNSLYFYSIGSIPLSASLTTEQETNIRSIVGMDEAEVLILFVGIGNYPENNFLTARSEREPLLYEDIETI